VVSGAPWLSEAAVAKQTMGSFDVVDPA